MPYNFCFYILLLSVIHLQNETLSSQNRSASMTNSKQLSTATNSSSITRSGRQRLCASVAKYTASLEEDIEHLLSFRSWALPKIAEQEMQMGRVRGELNELRNAVELLRYGAIVKAPASTPSEVPAHHITSPETSTSPITPASNRVGPTAGKNSRSNRNSERRRHVRISSYKPPAGRPCTFPADPNCFKFTFDDTATDSPPA